MGNQEDIQGLDNPNRPGLDMIHPRSGSSRPRPNPRSDQILEAVTGPRTQLENKTKAQRPVKDKTENLTVSLVIPVFNEEVNLGALIERCLKTCEDMGRPYEVVFVDDGSDDASPKIIEEAAKAHENRIIGVILNRNYGQHAAVIAGFAEARGDVIVTLDADLQNPPEEIPKLMETVEKGYDVVGTVRVPRCDTAFRRIASFLVNKAAQKATGVNMTDYGCMLRAYRRHIVDAMLDCPERSAFIPVLANSFARKATQIEVNHDKRLSGDSKYSVWKLINLQFDLLTSMTTFPLRLLTIIGGFISLVGVSFGVFLLIMRLVYGSAWAAEGVFTLFAFLFIFIGGQFVAMGLLGEYIGRIYHDVRGRPRYYVQQVVGRSNSQDDNRNTTNSEDIA